MAGIHKPKVLLDAKGSFINRPSRARPDEPTDDTVLGSAPTYLSPEEKKVWREVSKQLLPGVAKRSDRNGFELLVRLTTQMRNNYSTMMAADRTCMVSLLARFACTPADRAKVSVSKPKESKFSQFMNRKPNVVAITPPADEKVQ